MSSVKQVMTPALQFQKCNINSTLAECGAQMAKQHISSVVVYNQNDPVGIVTSQDVLRALFIEHKQSKDTIFETMSLNLQSVNQNSSTQDAAKKLSEMKKHHLFVDDGMGNIVGMVSTSDLIK